MKIDVGHRARRGTDRSIDPIRDSLKRETHFRREITRELAIWPLHTCSGRGGEGSCADPARSLDNGNNKEGQERRGEGRGEVVCWSSRRANFAQFSSTNLH